ncbi:MAG: DUF4070 domain-containing protein [Candidatus Krumholzibacteriota bacterium]|nr:DUF4070 domain-containing protein [Candidatus Krumholzibacteriota bacterium]
MKILLVNPATPVTFYSFDHALPFVSKRSNSPPLGLATVAAMLPGDWPARLVDLNLGPLRDEDLIWADLVFLTGMDIQRRSFEKVVQSCNQLGVRVVAGGPLVTAQHDTLAGVQHLVLGEAEQTLPSFLADLAAGQAKPLYRSDAFPDIASSPVPRWELLDLRKYAVMNVQYSRGCPYDCEFCTIPQLNGRRPRTKSWPQLRAELDALHSLGWHGGVFIVDDNFIGNRRKLRSDILPALGEWSRRRRHPFDFTTEVSIDLADDEELVRLMVAAGFENVFIGIETPNDESLAECGKNQNRRRDLLASVRSLQRQGLQVSAGFILGFDHDPPEIFQRLAGFIQQSGIVTAMVGLLNAPRGTRLFERLKAEKRLLGSISGDNTDGSTNFLPRMSMEKLQQGYRRVLDGIYSPRAYYARLRTFLREYRPPARRQRVRFADVKSLVKVMWVLGLTERGRRHFWHLFFYSLARCPAKFSVAMTLAVYGYHFRRVAAQA